MKINFISAARNRKNFLGFIIGKSPEEVKEKAKKLGVTLYGKIFRESTK